MRKRRRGYKEKKRERREMEKEEEGEKEDQRHRKIHSRGMAVATSCRDVINSIRLFAIPPRVVVVSTTKHNTPSLTSYRKMHLARLRVGVRAPARNCAGDHFSQIFM